MSSIERVMKWLSAIYNGRKNLTVVEDTVMCKGCKNSKVIIKKDGKTYEYSYDENGKQTVDIK